MTHTPVLPTHTIWQEQIQAKITRLLDAGRAPFADLSPEKWQELRTRWSSFLEEPFSWLRAQMGKPLEGRLLGETRYPDFRLQKIVFESFPGWQVGLSLFLPMGEGPFVPILCPCGHGAKWLDDHQIAPQVLARHGFAAALFDMPMFGEKERGNDHFIQGYQAQMTGLWSNNYFLVDVVRTADYLQTRPDMDFSSGIGVTGVSGGGFATLFTATIDPRLRAIAPVCSVAPLGGHCIEGLYTGCPENYLFGQARVGLDFDHLLCLAAPIPALVIGGTKDELFRPEQMQKSYDQAKTVYDLLGCGERLALYFEDSPHKYTQTMAEQTAAWMRRWLLRDERALTPLPKIELLSQADLDCGTRDTTLSMLQVIRRKAAELRQSRHPQTDRIGILNGLGIQLPDEPNTLIEEPQPRWGYPHLKKLYLERPQDLPLPVYWAEFPSAPQGLVIGFSDNPHKITSLRQDTGLYALARHVAIADMRGFGELEPPPTDYDLYQWASVDRAIGDLLYLCGESALGQQVKDAVTILEAFSARLPQQMAPLMVYGKGEAALPALLAALLLTGVDTIILDSYLASFELLAMIPAPIWKRYAYPPNILPHFDLPDLIAARREIRFILRNPLDGMGIPLSQEETLKLYGEGSSHVEVYTNCSIRTDPGFDLAGDRLTLSRQLRAWIDRRVG